MSGPGIRPFRTGAEPIRVGLLFGAVLCAALALVGAPFPLPLDAGLLAHVSGLLAGYIVAVMVTLMSRAPLLERKVGADRLARWHARSGRFFVGFMVVHAVSATVAFSIAQPVDLFSATVQVLGFPGLAAATVGSLLFVVIAVASIRMARQRMSYESWHTIHLLTYCALTLTFVHELAGPNLVVSPLLQVIWSLLFVSPLALVLRYRLLRPLEQALRHRLVVDRVIPEADGVVSIVLRGRHLEELAVEAGHFFRWRFLTSGGWLTAHPFSVSASPRQDRMRVTVKALGEGSSALHSVRPGTRVIAEGPYGTMTSARRTRDSVLLIAGGVGITPMRTLFEEIEAPGRLTLLYRVPSRDAAVFSEELEQIASHRGAHLVWMVGPSSDPSNALDAANLLRLVPDLADRDVYLCASPAMSTAARVGLMDAGLPTRHLHEEVFAL